MPDIKKIEANTQYNGQLSYHGHNKSIIINSASLLQAGAGALALGWRGACGLPCRSCRCWDGEGGRREPNCNAGLGDRRRAEGRRRTREDTEPGDRGSRRAASRETERAILLHVGLFLLGFVELRLLSCIWYSLYPKISVVFGFQILSHKEYSFSLL